jgi:hypothetical protein
VGILIVGNRSYADSLLTFGWSWFYDIEVIIFCSALVLLYFPASHQRYKNHHENHHEKHHQTHPRHTGYDTRQRFFCAGLADQAH